MMLSLETEQALAAHLMNIINHERMIEEERIRLNEIYDFQPNTAFRRVDRLRNFKLNAYDLASFMRDNGHNAYTSEIHDVLLAYDFDDDSHLDLLEFQQIFLTSTNCPLRLRARERFEEVMIGTQDRLSQEIEGQMTIILLLEMEGLKRLNQEKEELKLRSDFSRLQMFRAIDYYQLNNLLRDDMRMFLNKNGHYATAEDSDALMRRLDRGRDGRLSYKEFSKYIDSIHLQNLCNPKNSMIKDDTNVKSRNSRNQKLMVEDSEKIFSKTMNQKSSLGYGVREENVTPLKKVTFTSGHKEKSSNSKLASMNTTPSPTKLRITAEKLNKSPHNDSPLKYTPNQPRSGSIDLDSVLEDSLEEERESSVIKQQAVHSHEESIIKNKSRQYSPYFDHNEQKILAITLKSLLQLELDLESLKQELAVLADFNLLDAFKVFDHDSQGEVYLQEFNKGLQILELNHPRHEVETLFKRIDKNGDGRIRYLEFVDALKPKDLIYASHLQSKRPNYLAKSVFEAISDETLIDFAEVLRCMIINESESQILKKKLQDLEQFSLSAAFATLDCYSKGSLNKEDLKRFLDEQELYATQREIDLLFAQFDRDQDGKISYSEFFQALNA